MKVPDKRTFIECAIGKHAKPPIIRYPKLYGVQPVNSFYRLYPVNSTWLVVIVYGHSP